MSNGIHTKLNIPDLWFDFYARFLPGVAFVAVGRVVLFPCHGIPKGGEMVIIAFAGYLCGLLVQPISSYITGHIGRRIARKEGHDHLYIRKLSDRLHKSSRSREAMILSKMHGETTFFVQFFVLGTVLLLVLLSREREINTIIVINFFCLIGFVLGARATAGRRMKRAIDVDKVITESII